LSEDDDEDEVEALSDFEDPGLVSDDEDPVDSDEPEPLAEVEDAFFSRLSVR
jgi:hypothetical protein